MSTTNELPTFQQMRADAYAELGDVADGLRSDWQPGTGPTVAQGRERNEALRLISLAKDALNRAAHDDAGE